MFQASFCNEGFGKIDAAFLPASQLSKQVAAAAPDLQHAIGIVDEKIIGSGQQDGVVLGKNASFLRVRLKISHGRVMLGAGGWERIHGEDSFDRTTSKRAAKSAGQIPKTRSMILTKDSAKSG